MDVLFVEKCIIAAFVGWAIGEVIFEFRHGMWKRRK